MNFFLLLSVLKVKNVSKKEIKGFLKVILIHSVVEFMSPSLKRAESAFRAPAPILCLCVFLLLRTEKGGRRIKADTKGGQLLAAGIEREDTHHEKALTLSGVFFFFFTGMRDEYKGWRKESVAGDPFLR